MAYYYDQRPTSSRNPNPQTWQQHYHGSYRPIHDHYGTASGLRPDGYSYDPRYFYPSSQPSSRPSSSHSTSYAGSQSRRKWPPSPSVEDEVHALAKESNTPKTSDENGGEARSRGSIDQQPIILDANAPSDSDASAAADSTNGDIFDGRGSSSHADSLRNDEQRGRSHLSHLETDRDEVPVHTRRDPSPYAFAKPEKFTTNVLYNSGVHLSPGGTGPEGLTPTSAKRHSGSYAFVGDPQNKSKPDERSGRADSGYYASNYEGEVFDNHELGTSDTASLRERRKPAAFSFSQSDLKHARTSLYDVVAKDKRSSMQRGFSQPAQPQDAWRHNNSAKNASKTRFEDSPGKSSPSKSYTASVDDRSTGIPPPISLPNADAFTSSKSQSPKFSSAPPPPGAGYPSPPTTRTSSYRYEDSSPSEPRSQPSSRPGSRPSSRHNSRPPSPVSMANSASASSSSSRFGFDQSNRTSTYPPPSDRRTRPTSKLATSIQTDSPLPTPRSDIRVPDVLRPEKQPLPYPEGDPQLMPSMDDFAANAAGRKPSAIPNNPIFSRIRVPPSPATPVALSFDVPGSPRPRLVSRHTLGEEYPKTGSRPSSRGSTISEFNLDFKPNIPSLPKLPPCPRFQYSRDYHDWYTLDGCPSFDICPNCLADIVAPSGFLRYFKPAPRRPAHIDIRCDFGTPWMRLAWLLTLKQQRGDLELIYALARIYSIEPECPGSSRESGIYHNVLDSHGNTISNFNICARDAKLIAALMPTLRGYLRAVYPSGPRDQKSICDLRLKSLRFPEYLDLLLEIHEKATAEGNPPDLRPFVELVRQKSKLRECRRDNLKPGERWHYIPSLTEFTVCEECYNDVVLPYNLSNNRTLATLFCTTPQRLPREGELGTSCQLYSRRMRKIFRRAVEENDFDYLARKARARKEMENELKRDLTQLVQLQEMGRGWQGRGGSAVDHEFVKREKERIEEHWRKWE